jgi:hypothetical protein
MNNAFPKIAAAVIFLILTLISLQQLIATNNPRAGEIALLLGVTLLLFIIGMILGKINGRW